jgi:alpha-tubulin suppressor-like RCC1 family protein
MRASSRRTVPSTVSGSPRAARRASGTNAERTARTHVADLASVGQIALGDAFSCARTTSGEVRCWGNNTAAQLGTDTVSFTSEVPVRTNLPASAYALGAGRQHACAAVGDDRRLFCWGSRYTVPV